MKRDGSVWATGSPVLHRVLRRNIVGFKQMGCELQNSCDGALREQVIVRKPSVFSSSDRRLTSVLHPCVGGWRLWWCVFCALFLDRTLTLARCFAALVNSMPTNITTSKTTAATTPPLEHFDRVNRLVVHVSSSGDCVLLG